MTIELFPKRENRKWYLNKARNLARRAVKLGYLKKLPCEVCSSEESEAHHPNYIQPLCILWLCRVHHRKATHRHPPLDLLAKKFTKDKKFIDYIKKI